MTSQLQVRLASAACSAGALGACAAGGGLSLPQHAWAAGLERGLHSTYRPPPQLDPCLRLLPRCCRCPRFMGCSKSWPPWRAARKSWPRRCCRWGARGHAAAIACWATHRSAPGTLPGNMQPCTFISPFAAIASPPTHLSLTLRCSPPAPVPPQAGISDTLRNLLATSSLLAAGTVSPGNVLRSAEQVGGCCTGAGLAGMLGGLQAAQSACKADLLSAMPLLMMLLSLRFTCAPAFSPLTRSWETWLAWRPRCCRPSPMPRRRCCRACRPRPRSRPQVGWDHWRLVCMRLTGWAARSLCPALAPSALLKPYLRPPRRRGAGGGGGGGGPRPRRLRARRIPAGQPRPAAEVQRRPAAPHDQGVAGVGRGCGCVVWCGWNGEPGVERACRPAGAHDQGCKLALRRGKGAAAGKEASGGKLLPTPSTPPLHSLTAWPSPPGPLLLSPPTPAGVRLERDAAGEARVPHHAVQDAALQHRRHAGGWVGGAASRLRDVPSPCWRRPLHFWLSQPLLSLPPACLSPLQPC